MIFLELNTCDDEEAAAVVAEFSHEYLGDDDQPGVERPASRCSLATYFPGFYWLDLGTYIGT